MGEGEEERGGGKRKVKRMVKRSWEGKWGGSSWERGGVADRQGQREGGHNSLYSVGN